MTPKEILDHPVVAARCFFPRRARLEDPFVVLNAGVALHCHRSATHEHGPWLLHFHGNGEVVADWLPGFTPGLVDAGLNVVLGEYRGYGGSSGSPALASMLDDALAITDALGVDPGALVVYGRSVGTIYALHVAAHRPVAGLVIESGIADVRERLALRLRAEELGVDDAQLQAAVDALLNHRAKVQAFRGRMLVLHAQGDVLVRPDHAVQLAEWGGARASLQLFERGNHNTIHAFNGDQIIETVAGFVHEVTGA
ncbi:temperature sensitive supressor-like protein [Enhygromyxa salina]|uniref:Temperature sensitive supressor-like protein n=1 Tax=Enhygromyxa salina TaxID=215803 RepID=A0A0C2D988_9BACT|nr:alpha/beta fold hydrolase [Enhygromyxa salina]KIG16547.1 temperature sensitive supressor-like protein [Enhygromyxa salina]